MLGSVADAEDMVQEAELRLHVSAASARQRSHRAKRRLSGVQQPKQTPLDAQKHLLDSMVMKLAARDIDGLIALMSEDAVAYTDGGGVVSAAIVPVQTPQRIAQVTSHLMQKTEAEGPVSMSYQRSNGGWALVLRQHGAVHSCIMLDGRDGRVRNVYVIRNPEKLRRLAATTN